MMNSDKSRILIVDDENANIAVLREILRKDYAVSAVKTGQAAVKSALDDNPDLILLDILMPDMDGFEVLAQLKSTELTRNIPVIFITGLSGIDDEAKGLTLGAVDYITKPFNNSIVLARVGAHVKIIRQMRIIEHLGMTDALTDIPNRRFFDIRIDEEWRRMSRSNSPLSMLMLDVDKFKVYNDTYGHPQGDLLLKYVAKSLTANLRRPSDIAARIGGEEFAVILADTDLTGALTVAENIRAMIEAGVVPDASTGEATSVTVSIGVHSLVPGADSDSASLLSEADKNLYTAKSTGRNKVVG
ncbi:MAG: diguanylate cyclase [Oscillospiraceae bacterium]|jgi:diguanylate cyclase (GGDEF)-like protein|nr:diguanylate cyclase [Oscillospiraceae bacterium]